jgi:hypothetical protein
MSSDFSDRFDQARDRAQVNWPPMEQLRGASIILFHLPLFYAVYRAMKRHRILMLTRSGATRDGIPPGAAWRRAASIRRGKHRDLGRSRLAE